MTSAPKPFVYTPLGPGEIRVLEHHVEDGSSEPTWILRVINIGDAGQGVQNVKFDALSYTWGDPKATFPLILNGRKIQIHRNLHEALPYLSRLPSRCPIWVDAVCINQKDKAEKKVQIPRMKEIYRRAIQVWVWLGPGIDHTAEAIKLLPRISHTGEGDPPAEMPDELPELDSPIWTSIFNIVDNSWFGRVWIVQESALARDLRFLMGRHEINAEMLKTAVSTSSRLAEHFLNASMRDEAKRLIDTQRAMSIFGIRDLVQRSFALDPNQPRAPRELVWIIYQMTINSDCSEPRDRVNGTLGLLPDDQRRILGDFSDTASLAELYASFGQRVLTQPNPPAPMWFAFLHRGTISGKRSNLPSWCPDFHQSSESLAWYEDGITLGLDTRRNFHASRKDITARPGEGTQELVSLGCLVDDISQIHERIPIPLDFLRRENTTTDYLEAYLYLREFERSIARNSLSQRAFEVTESLEPFAGVEKDIRDEIDRLWKTLFSGFETFQGRQVTIEYYYALRRGLDELAASVERSGWRDNEVFRALTMNDPFQKAFFCAMYSILHRKVFVTTGGRLGLGGGSMHTGDKIILLNGGQMPHVAGRKIFTGMRGVSIRRNAWGA
ncbi:unnamed protein product [Clonostachys byssicola]|uniref:Heterokaryon incompatibility domain-containing protein n=1 Tax=Clonostachys byssicola TaxID=160290 RepID=A0A9N9UUB1_9HYPO|nr:unnamed protein product [Clonostachys byssicola]